VRQTTVSKLAGGITARKYYTPPPTPLPQTVSLPQPSHTDKKKLSNSSPAQNGPIDVSSVHRVHDIQDNTDDDLTTQKERVMETYGQDEDEDLDPTTAFVRLKLQIDNISSRPRSQTNVSEVDVLRRKMDEIQKDYLFNQKEALSMYQAQKQKADKLLLHAKLRSQQPEVVSNVQNSKVVGKTMAEVPTPVKKTSDGNESDDSSVGILGILENPDSTEVTVKGVTYNLRDMALPKNWSGSTPKNMLRDFVVKSDKYAAISYSRISDHSRARRASVTISWQSKMRDEWSMDDVACLDDSQAEQYVATIALHSLLYPVTDGFVSSAPTSTGGSTSFRLLPAIYRELWEELEISRKERDDSLNRTIWAKLRSLLEAKLRNTVKVYVFIYLRLVIH